MREINPIEIEKYLSRIQQLEVGRKFSKRDLLISDFRLHQSGNLEIYYAPFNYIKPEAKLFIAGITPGWTQMELAYRCFRQGLQQKKSRVEIYADIEQTASFAGSMRSNLINMLEELRIAKYLKIDSCESLFSENHHLIHTTSVIRNPVFVNSKNYTGHNPRILNNPILKTFVHERFSQELDLVPNTLIIPQGKAVSEVLEYLIAQEKLNPKRCLLNFPHASGANGHRKKLFQQFRQQMQMQVEEYFLANSANPEPTRSVTQEASSEKVIRLLKSLQDYWVCIDGGWGVDVLLGVQTRVHSDLDLIIREDETPAIAQTLLDQGFTRVSELEGLVYMFDGLFLDLHPVRFDQRNYGHFNLPDGGSWPFPSQAFEANGHINGYNVRCLSVNAQILCHAQGYSLSSKDRVDMKALQEKFGCVLPLSFYHYRDLRSTAPES